MSLRAAGECGLCLFEGCQRSIRFWLTVVCFSLTFSAEFWGLAVSQTVFALALKSFPSHTTKNCQTAKNSRQSAPGLVFDRAKSYVLRTRARVPCERLAAQRDPAADGCGATCSVICCDDQQLAQWMLTGQRLVFDSALRWNSA